MKKIVIFIIMLLSISVISMLITGYYYLRNFSQQIIHLNQPNQLFTLARGTSVAQLAQQVEKQGLIEHADLIPYLIKLTPSLNSIKSGTYALTDNMTVMQFLQLLNSGKEAQFAIKFVEGKRAKDWLAALESAPNIEYKLSNLSLDEIAKLLGINTSIEGWLYPDTYNYTFATTDLAILKRAYKKMQTVLETVWDERDKNLPYKTAYDLLIMASIIEKETGIDIERTKVASVFINRLKYKMQLQTDPTVIYGMGDDYNGHISTKDLRNKNNPYNTYVIWGLPPTPIAMPSLSSLKAAAHPEQTNYLYFVASGNGGHIFSTNYNAHKQAVDQYWQLMRQQRNQNKSINQD